MNKGRIGPIFFSVTLLYINQGTDMLAVSHNNFKVLERQQKLSFSSHNKLYFKPARQYTFHADYTFAPAAAQMQVPDFM